jgi:bifunctional DNA-binding transcriptional regulator/antitoxin component of YhaV-PrlF toxin-antitoxin module
MKTKSFLYEKGRVYIPTKCRENLGIKGEWFKASRVISKDIGEDVYYKWLTEKTRVYMKEEALGHYKKRGWKNLVIIAKVGTRFWLERQWHFLAIYSPLLHMEVNLAAEVTGRWDLTLVKMILLALKCEVSREVKQRCLTFVGDSKQGAYYQVYGSYPGYT